jgi:hypothetical protein
VSANTISGSAAAEACSVVVQPPRLEASVASELNALWRSIFERVRAAERQHDDGSGPSRSGVAARGLRDAQAFARDLEAQRDSADLPVEAHPAASGAADAIVMAPAVRDDTVTVPEPSARSAALSDANPRASSAASPIVSVAIVYAPSSDAEAVPPSVERARATDAAHRPLAPSVDADEAVNVFVRPRAVAIAVRNATLTDDEALRCAFETASALAGERAALRELTLNGRTVYRQSSLPDSAASPTLVFAC